MHKIRVTSLFLITMAFAACGSEPAKAPADAPPVSEVSRWSAERANQWYERIGWLSGSNFSPSSAINQLEMWQADSFDPETIDRELGWAEDLGFNSMRVYLHDLLWRQDSEGFLSRTDRFLDIADSHGSSTACGTLTRNSGRSESRSRICTIPIGSKAPEPKFFGTLRATTNWKDLSKA